MKKQLYIIVVILLMAGVGVYAVVRGDADERAQRQLQAALPPVEAYQASSDTAPEVAVLDGDEDAATDTQGEPVLEPGDAEVEPVVGDLVAEKKQAVNYAVPFTPQAPHANWGLPYQEACEEASVLMATAFFDASAVDLSTADAADKEILDLVAFEEEQYGFHLDTTAAETVRFAQARYPQVQFELMQDPTVEGMRDVLRSGGLIIVPAAGQQLGNPFFSGAGPVYHMFVVRGFNAENNTFVTNDPGTRRGESYVYRADVLMNAMGDWNDGDPANGDKVVIVVRGR